MSSISKYGTLDLVDTVAVKQKNLAIVYLLFTYTSGVYLALLSCRVMFVL